jgi:hypothetical protein
MLSIMRKAWWPAIACFASVLPMLLVSCGSRPIDPQESKQASCDLLLSRYRPAVAAVFEIEMRQRGYSEWDRSLKELGVSPLNADGNVGDPQSVANSVLGRLTGITDANKRNDLEYTLLSGAMPLDARRAFEQYCVPGNSPSAPNQ